MPNSDSEGWLLSAHQIHAKLAARTRGEAVLIARVVVDMDQVVVVAAVAVAVAVVAACASTRVSVATAVVAATVTAEEAAVAVMAEEDLVPAA